MLKLTKKKKKIQHTIKERLVNKGDVRTYVFYMLRTYVIILCNWFIL